MHISQTIFYPSSHPQLIFWFEFLTPLSTETSAALAQKSDIETPQAEYSFSVYDLSRAVTIGSSPALFGSFKLRQPSQPPTQSWNPEKF